MSTLASILFLHFVAAAGASEPAVAEPDTNRIVQFVQASTSSVTCAGYSVLAEGIRRVACLESSAGCHTLFIVPLLCKDTGIRLSMIIMSPDGSLILKEKKFLFLGDGDVSATITTGTAGKWRVGVIATGEPGVDDPYEQHWWYAYNPINRATEFAHLGIAYYSYEGMRGLAKAEYRPEKGELNLTWECESTGEPPNKLSVVKSHKVINGNPVLRSHHLSARFHLSKPLQTHISPSTTSALGATLSRGFVETSDFKDPRWWKLRQGNNSGWQLEGNIEFPQNWNLDSSGEIGCLSL